MNDAIKELRITFLSDTQTRKDFLAINSIELNQEQTIALKEVIKNMNQEIDALNNALKSFSKKDV